MTNKQICHHLQQNNCHFYSYSVWPDLAIYWTLGNFEMLLATLNLHKSLTFLRNFCKGVKIYHFSSKIIFGQVLWKFGNFFLVTLLLLQRETIRYSLLPYFFLYNASWFKFGIYCFISINKIFLSLQWNVPLMGGRCI